jgi:hypothetical protein
MSEYRDENKKKLKKKTTFAEDFSLNDKIRSDKSKIAVEPKQPMADEIDEKFTKTLKEFEDKENKGKFYDQGVFVEDNRNNDQYGRRNSIGDEDFIIFFPNFLDIDLM